jgi:hypothetical protein
MGYNTEITADVEKKMITVNGKNRPIKDFIEIPEEKDDVITTKEKKKFIDFEDKNKEVEVPKEDWQENRDNALNDRDNGSD